MGNPRPWLAVLAGAIALLFCAPAADAATYTLRPDATAFTNNVWWIDGGTTPWGVLDDALTQPTTPASGDQLYTDADARPDVRVDVQDRTLGAGEVVTNTIGWAYVGTHPSRSIRFELMHGTTVLAGITVPGGSQPGWRRLESTVALTQAQLNTVNLRFL